MCRSILPEQGGADRDPVSPHPLGSQSERAARIGQPGSTGSPQPLHTPKKSVLRPRGSKARNPELALIAHVSAPSATSVGFNDITAVNSKGANLAGMPGEDSISCRAGTQPYGYQESPRKDSSVRTGVLLAKGSNEHIKDKPVRDIPSTPSSPTALQAKFQRLKVKWSALAECDQSPSDSASAFRLVTATGRALIKNSIPVSVNASAPFTIVELDGEGSESFFSWPGSTESNTLPVPAASAGESADASSSHAMSVAKADSADDRPIQDNPDSEPARSAWEDALGLPAGIKLWGPTVSELPVSAFAREVSKSFLSTSASASLQTGLIYVTAPRPIAEAVERESSDASSHLTSPTTATTSFSEMRSPVSHTETDNPLKVQGNSVFEEATSPLTSPTSTPSASTLETATASIPKGAKHSPMRPDGEEPKEASLLSPRTDMMQGSANAAPGEAEERRTLDQKLSTERASPHDEVSKEAQWQPSSSPAGSMPEVLQSGSAREPGLYLDEAQPAAAKADGDGRVVATCNGNVPPIAEQGAAGKDADENEASGAQHTLPEPAVLDRGEPTFEDTIRSQETRATGRKSIQLLPPRKQAPPGQWAQGSGSPQRSFSPFGRLGCVPRAHPDQTTGYRKEITSGSLGVKAETLPYKPKEASESAQGPGPLEKGIHEIELGGYYLTTPDPLRTDPGFARPRRASSEHSAQCTAQQEQHARDPLNCAPVQYVSSPVWRRNTLTALDQLPPNMDPSAVSESERRGMESRAISLPATIRQMQGQTPCSEHRDHRYREHRRRIEHGSQPCRRIREGRETSRGTASRSSAKVQLGLAKLQDGAHSEGSSRAHVKERTPRGNPPDKRRIHRHVVGHHAGRPPSSEVSI